MKKNKSIFILSFALIFLAVFVWQNNNKLVAVENSFTLTWSSNSSVPLEYEGLPLPIRGSEIKVFALPTKKLTQDPEKLVYRWVLDGAVMGWANGEGKSSFVFKSNKWAGDNYEVVSQILDGETVIWRGTVKIRINNPEILFKSANSDYSVQEKISSGTNQTLTVLGIPLFFNTNNQDDLNFKWQIDGYNLTSYDSADLNTFSLKIPAGKLDQTMIKNLRLTISDKNDDTQQASSQIILEIK
jgi:hypothetical protein